MSALVGVLWWICHKRHVGMLHQTVVASVANIIHAYYPHVKSLFTHRIHLHLADLGAASSVSGRSLPMDRRTRLRPGTTPRRHTAAQRRVAQPRSQQPPLGFPVGRLRFCSTSCWIPYDAPGRSFGSGHQIGRSNSEAILPVSVQVSSDHMKLGQS